ncbi:MAG: hypothetical protein Q9198_007748, partial [Flavoplaca austrocitrina]
RGGEQLVRYAAMDDTTANAAGRRDQCAQLGERERPRQARHERVGKRGGSAQEATDRAHTTWWGVKQAEPVRCWLSRSSDLAGLVE